MVKSRFKLRRDIGIKRPARRDVHDLLSAANSEQRQVIRQRHTRNRDFERVPFGIRRGNGRMRFAAAAFDRDVAAADDKDTVEMVG